jgi:hypothetical protein
MVKRAGYRLAPAATATISAIRSRRLSQRLVRDWGLIAIDDRLVERFGMTVQTGPFAGTVLPQEARAEHLAPYLLGTYECELHSWFEELRAIPFVCVIDVGAKFGYYALGLARWFPEAESIAYDTDPWARRALRSGERANGISRFTVRGYPRPSELAGLLGRPTLIVSDCEGFELELFGGVEPWLFSGTSMIIEVHPDEGRGVETFLKERFSGSHRVDVRAPSDREPSLELVALLGEANARRAVTEARGAQRWMFLRPAEGRGERGVPPR